MALTKDEKISDGMIGVMNNDARLINLPDVGGQSFNLRPGMNMLPVDYVREVCKHRDVADMLMAGTASEGRRALIEVGATGKPLIPTNVKETLTDLSERDAISLVRDATEAQLTVWSGTERRGPVINAIKERIAALAPKR